MDGDLISAVVIGAELSEYPTVRCRLQHTVLHMDEIASSGERPPLFRATLKKPYITTQVLITRFSPVFSSAVTFLSSFSLMYGPFFSDLGIVTILKI